MANKTPILLPKIQRILDELGENIKLARLSEIIGQIDPLKSLQIDPPFEGTKLECLKSG
jgi:hypothetical protein